MKLLSIAIPSYNSEAYLEHAVQTLLPGGDEVEILIVNDGSKDGTAALADRLEAENPGIVRAIHKPNGGHGDAVMCGLHHATGMYFKVVDSDDWVDAETYPKILDVLRRFTKEGEQLDLMLSNYIYDKVGVEHKHVVRYANALPVDRVFTWDEVGHFRMGQYILMHSAIYRTQFLLDCGLSLPKHTFYVDSLYVYQPMPYVKRMYYMDEVFYHYFIGRDDQSVQEQVMIKRMDQQVKVNKLMISGTDLTKVENIRCRKYMRNYAEIITTVSIVLMDRSGTPEHLAMRKELWDWMKAEHPGTYKMLRHRPLGILLHIPGAFGRKVAVIGYSVAQKFFGFS